MVLEAPNVSAHNPEIHLFPKYISEMLLSMNLVNMLMVYSQKNPINLVGTGLNND